MAKELEFNDNVVETDFLIPGFDRESIENQSIRSDIRSQLHRIVDVALDQMDSPEEMFKLKDTFVALNGLVIRIKGKF